MAKYLLL